MDVNRQGLDETVLVLRSGSRLYVGADDLARWRLHAPGVAPLLHEGRSYYPLDALPGVKFELHEAAQRLAIETAADAFSGTVSALERRGAPRPVVPQPGGFLNYALSLAHVEPQTTRAGLFEAGLFSRHGVLTGTVLAATLDRGSDWVRLDTTYTADDPAHRATLRLGDSATRAGAWGRAVRFAGAQYGTNFGTQPGFIPFPVTAALGQAALPSTVDVFVNNALVAQRAIPPGPFAITDIPVVTGSGDVRMVVRDLLGRESVYTQRFYGSTTLLRRGISDYSVEAGALREDFGLASNHYSGPIAAATHRSGITDRLTAEARAEHSEIAAVAGASAALLAADIAVLNASAALSRSEHGTGHLFGYGFERNARPFSLALHTLLADSDFRQAGMAPEELPRRRQSVAAAGVQLGWAGSLSATHIVQRSRSQPSLEVLTLAYAVPLARFGQVSVAAVRTAGAGGGSALFATLAVPLGETTSASAGLERIRANDAPRAEYRRMAALQKSLPPGEGYGYRVQARDDELYGSYSLQTGVGTYGAELATSDDGPTATRLTASGGIGTLGGHTFASRTITDSFAVVRVADFENVRVLHDNQVAARTGAGGYAVLPRVRAYDRNPVAIEQADLPLDARIGGLRVEAVPYFRSGVFVDFPVRRVRAATFRVVLEDGADLPAGALARVEDKPGDFPVGLNGEAYVEGLEASSRVVVTWRGRSCALDLSYPAGGDPLPHLGTFVCQGVLP